MGAYDEGRVDEPGAVEVALGDSQDDRSTGKGKSKGLRGFLQRRGSAANNGVSSSSGGASVNSGSRGKAKNNQPLISAYEMDLAACNTAEEAPTSRPPSRGRRASKSPSRDRARSLEERRIRNPNIARKFGKLLRVYGDDGGDRQRAHV